MKVLHLYSGNLFGGIERLLLTLARQRPDSDAAMQGTYALCFEGTLSSKLREAGARVEMLGAIRASRPWTGWLARRRLAKLLLRQPFDVVIAHACWPLAMLGPAVARHASNQGGSPRLVLWAHDILTGRHWVERRVASVRPDLILANSQATSHSLASVFPAVRSQIVYYPVEMAANLASPADRQAARAQVRRELSTPDDAVVVICASRLERWKGHAVLIEALGKLADHPGWVLWLAGGAQRAEEENYLAELRGSAQRLGILNRIRFLGQRSDVPRLLAAADIHCQPNTGPEPFGIAFIEAMSAGLALVTSDIGAAPEILQDDSGILVKAGDPDSLASALRTMINEEALRQRLGQSASARARVMCDPPAAIGRIVEALSDGKALEAPGNGGTNSAGSPATIPARTELCDPKL